MSKILDLGNQENERILIDVLEDCNLGSYILALSNIVNDNSISSKIENIYWLENQELKKGDIVVVYTMRNDKGVKTIQNASGATSFFLFWQLGRLLHEFSNKKVVCLETTWSTLNIGEINSEGQSEGN